MTIWQIAAGSEQRDYVEDFLTRGIAFVGGTTQIATLAKVQVDDILVLKIGMSKVRAVGKVVERNGKHHGVGDKHWLKDFDGWDLEAYVYVDWHQSTEPIPVTGLTRGTISRINSETVRSKVMELYSTFNPITEILPEPNPTQEVKDEHILSELITQGMSPRVAEDLTSAFARIRRLARYYRNDCQWSDVREHETRTFLVVPLLLALGWSEQQVKVELAVPKGRIDLACFGRPYRRVAGVANEKDCQLIIETKGFSQGLNLAPSQVRGYAEHYPSTRAVVVTNGYCYKLYSKVNGTLSVTPTSYLNLLDPRSRYPLDPDRTAGCLDVLRELLPG